MSGSSSVLTGLAGDRPAGPPPADEMAAILEAAAARHIRTGPALKIRRYSSDEGPAFWRWDCVRCGEYGGGRHHPDAVTRALRHCAEHPHHRSSLLPPARCRERESGVPQHPMLFAVDDDPPPPPLSI
ncbi:MAG TPA: hypothetical protein VFH03_02460 [Actinoplanes sp.]|nr:hypothetical protein [Actinoplanes sp.]